MPRSVKTENPRGMALMLQRTEPRFFNDSFLTSGIVKAPEKIIRIREKGPGSEKDNGGGKGTPDLVPKRRQDYVDRRMRIERHTSGKA